MKIVNAFRLTYLFVWISLVTLAVAPKALGQECVMPPSGIISWWALDETDGSMALDIVGNNHGIYVNDPVPEAGLAGGSLRLDGIDDFIGLGSSDLVAFGSNDFTIELWVRFHSLTRPSGIGTGPRGDMSLVDKMDPGGFNADGWRLVKQDNNRFWFCLGASTNGCQANASTTVQSATVLTSDSLDSWIHVAAVKASDTIAIYVNGSQEAQKTIENNFINTDAANLFLGNNILEEHFLSGNLDEVTLYDRALNNEEIRAIFDAGPAGKCKKVSITTNVIPAVQIDSPYSFELEAINGVPPYTWSIIEGDLPTGLILSANGSLNGLPEALGAFPLVIQVSDAMGQSDTKSYSLEVYVDLPPSEVQVTKTGTVAVPGRVLDYFILVENKGEVIAEDVSISEALEPWFTFENSSPEIGLIERHIDTFPDINSEDEYDAVLTWELPELQPGEVKILSYSAQLDPMFPQGLNVQGQVCHRMGPLFGEFTCGQRYQDCMFSARAVCDLEEDLVTQANCQRFLANQCALEREACYFSHCIDDGRTKRSNNVATLCGGCATHEQQVTGPIDPNEKHVIAPKYIQPDQLLVYPILYENIGPVEAIDVFITDILDPNLDISTLSIISSEQASFDPVTRKVQWSLIGTNLQPNDTDTVFFSIKPLPGLASGTEIRNRARIRFEVVDSLDTNEVVNIIDTTMPTCIMSALPDSAESSSFKIAWMGEDLVGEIDSYSIYVSSNGEGYKTFALNTIKTDTTFVGEEDSIYEFFCTARDVAGNIEVQEAVAEATTVVGTAIKRAIDKGIPEEFTVFQNYPNPFSQRTTIQFNIATVEHITLDVYDILGRRIATLFENQLGPGKYSVDWDGTNDAGFRVANGIYIYMLKAGNYSESREMLLQN